MAERAQVPKLAPHGLEEGAVIRHEAFVVVIAVAIFAPAIRDLAAPQLAAELARADERGQHEQQHHQGHEPGQGRGAVRKRPRLGQRR